MALVDPVMGLTIWNGPLDPYDYLQLANDWNILAFHDHTRGRGVQIPYGGLAANSVGNVNLQPNAVNGSNIDSESDITVDSVTADNLTSVNKATFGNIKYGTGSITLPSNPGSTLAFISAAITHNCVDSSGAAVIPSAIVLTPRFNITVAKFTSGNAHGWNLGVDHVTTPPTSTQFYAYLVFLSPTPAYATLGSPLNIFFDWMAFA